MFAHKSRLKLHLEAEQNDLYATPLHANITYF